MRTARLPPVRISVVTPRCHYCGDGEGVGPQVNKFEQVSRVYHRMSVARSDVWEGGTGG